MSSTEDNIIAFVDEQLASIFAAPSMWGSSEAIELQVIQLLEVRALTLRPEIEKRNPRGVLEAFQRLVSETFPNTPPYPLHGMTEEYNRQDEFIPLLQKLSDQIIQDMQPEDILAAHDLVLRLCMREGIKVPRAGTVSSYYEALHRVLRAVARPDGTRGRSNRELERAIDFAMPEVRVKIADGGQAQVVLLLDQIESAETDRVKLALEEIVTVNEWAADSGSRVADLRARLPNESAPQRVVAQALRLMPSEEDAVQTVELGGRLVERPRPVVIQPFYAPRMLEVIKEDVDDRRDFDRVGTVRAVDIDQRSMRVNVEGKSYKCWMDEQRLVAVARGTLGNRVRVIGHQYNESGSTVIIVHAIQP